MPLGRWLHHEWLATHWPWFQMVAMQHCPVWPFPQVGLVSLILIWTEPWRYHQFFYSFSGNDSGETATCLFNSPHEDAVLPRVLPGKLLSLDAQCRMDRGTSACFVSPGCRRSISIQLIRFNRVLFYCHNRKTIVFVLSCSVSTPRLVTAFLTDRQQKARLVETAR